MTPYRYDPEGAAYSQGRRDGHAAGFAEGIAQGRAEMREIDAPVIDAAETILGFADSGETDNALYTIGCDLRVALAARDRALDASKEEPCIHLDP